MPWGVGHHRLRELETRSRVAELTRRNEGHGPLDEAAAGTRKRPSLFRRIVRRIRGGGD